MCPAGAACTSFAGVDNASLALSELVTWAGPASQGCALGCYRPTRWAGCALRDLADENRADMLPVVARGASIGSLNKYIRLRKQAGVGMRIRT